jgi:hypothetical protein
MTFKQESNYIQKSFCKKTWTRVIKKIFCLCTSKFFRVYFSTFCPSLLAVSWGSTFFVEVQNVEWQNVENRIVEWQNVENIIVEWQNVKNKIVYLIMFDINT